MKETARAGRGSATLVQDGGDQLKSCVIRALSHAMESSLEGVQYGWNDQLLEKEHELYRNQLVFQTQIMSKEMFESVSFVFKTNPETGDKIDLRFGPADFKRVEGEQAAQALIKLAAFQRLEKEKGTEQV